jgi:ketosteroid isomerase-like protein
MTPDQSLQDSNKERVRASFDRWAQGTGSPFELLLKDAEWTIVGSSPLSKTYRPIQAFLEEVIHPFNARLRTPLIPTVRDLFADGDAVITLFDAAATAADGLPYQNTYTWYFWMKDGKVTKALAFFDTREFDEFWRRVKPKHQPGQS